MGVPGGIGEVNLGDLQGLAFAHEMPSSARLAGQLLRARANCSHGLELPTSRAFFVGDEIGLLRSTLLFCVAMLLSIEFWKKIYTAETKLV